MPSNRSLLSSSWCRARVPHVHCQERSWLPVQVCHFYMNTIVVYALHIGDVNEFLYQLLLELKAEAAKKVSTCSTGQMQAKLELSVPTGARAGVHLNQTFPWRCVSLYILMIVGHDKNMTKMILNYWLLSLMFFFHCDLDVVFPPFYSPKAGSCCTNSCHLKPRGTLCGLKLQCQHQASCTYPTFQ